MIQIQTQLARNGTQQTKTRRRRRRGKIIKEISTLTLLEPLQHQPRLRPDHVAMQVEVPGENLLRRNDVQPVWLLHLAERPCARQSVILLFHRLLPDDRGFVRTRCSIGIRRRELAWRVGRGGILVGGACWKTI